MESSGNMILGHAALQGPSKMQYLGMQPTLRELQNWQAIAGIFGILQHATLRQCFGNEISGTPPYRNASLVSLGVVGVVGCRWVSLGVVEVGVVGCR